MSEPRVAIVMGSDSDFDVMVRAADVLDEFGIHYQMKVLSAHRTPDELAQWAKALEGRGVKMVIAGAGGSAALAGTVAAVTTLPVIGVPIPTPHLQGLDSLYSTVQMPGGVPVASMGIGSAGAKNAAIFAVQILSLSDARLSDRIREQRREQKAACRKKDERVQTLLAQRSEAR